MLQARFAMRPISTQSSNQLHDLFGGTYIPERRGDETYRYLPPTEKREFVVDFDAVIKALRAALSLR